MIKPLIKRLLKANWGEKSDTLNCKPLVRLFDPLSKWCCYIFAMHEDENLVHCIIYNPLDGPEIYTLNTLDIYTMYNEHGESPMIDEEYRPIAITTLLGRLRHDT